jgi:hypothetical protein
MEDLEKSKKMERLESLIREEYEILFELESINDDDEEDKYYEDLENAMRYYEMYREDLAKDCDSQEEYEERIQSFEDWYDEWYDEWKSALGK